MATWHNVKSTSNGTISNVQTFRLYSLSGASTKWFCESCLPQLYSGHIQVSKTVVISALWLLLWYGRLIA